MRFERVFDTARQRLNKWEKTLDAGNLGMGLIFAPWRNRSVRNADKPK
jgi:hypothetical protein